MNDAVRTIQHTSYWLLVRDGRDGVEVLSNRLGSGQKALPVFSFEEEAEMFLCLRGSEEGSQDGWRPEEFVADDLLPLFYTFLEEVACVTLDPILENSFLDNSGLLSITREDFLARLVWQRIEEKTGENTGTVHPLRRRSPKQRTG